MRYGHHHGYETPAQAQAREAREQRTLAAIRHIAQSQHPVKPRTGRVLPSILSVTQ